AGAAELLLHLGQFAGLLEGAERADDGVEEVQQDQGAIVIEVQGAVAGPVAGAAVGVEALEQGQELLEVLAAGEWWLGRYVLRGHKKEQKGRANEIKAAPDRAPRSWGRIHKIKQSLCRTGLLPTPSLPLRKTKLSASPFSSPFSSLHD